MREEDKSGRIVDENTRHKGSSKPSSEPTSSDSSCFARSGMSRANRDLGLGLVCITPSKEALEGCPPVDGDDAPEEDRRGWLFSNFLLLLLLLRPSI